MYSYSFNLSKWVNQYLRTDDRKPKRLGILNALLSPFFASSDKSLHNSFLQFVVYARLRSRYNCQQGSLQALLNRLFDPEEGRIYLVTSADTILTKYGSLASDNNVSRIYASITSDSLPVVYGKILNDYVTNVDGVVFVPSELVGREAEIRKWVDFNLFLGKTYAVAFF